MSDLLLVPRLKPTITRLQSIWPLGRKALIEQLRQHVAEADEHMVRIQAQGQRLEAELSGIRSELGVATDELEQLQPLHEQLRATNQEQSRQLNERRAAYETLYGEHASLIDSHVFLQAAAELVQRRYRLVCNILNSKPAKNPSLSELKSWFADDFARDVQRLELPANITSTALDQARSIALHADILNDSPALRTKFLVAVAGGFSSGKSSFVTSFMHRAHSQLLAKGIQPVTAIPTYVMPGSELSIYGHTRKGAHVALNRDEYAELTHDFIANMGFNVKEIMPHVVIEAPMPDVQHLAFIDMPGYDPAASDTADTAADQDIASAAMSEADAVIWLIALDTNGTLPANDLEFLLQHADDRPLYVVLNKADLRPMSTLQDVIGEIREHLEGSGIQYEGICAYSSTLGKELLHEGKSLNDVMRVWDHFSDAAASLYKEFDSLIKALKKHSRQQHKKAESLNELAHSLTLDILQVAGSESELFKTSKSRINRLKKLAEGVSCSGWEDASNRLEKMQKYGTRLLRENFETGNPATPEPPYFPAGGIFEFIARSLGIKQA